MAISHEEVLQSVLESQQGYDLSIIKLSEPVSRGPQKSGKERTSDVSTDVFDNPTPASLEADLLHYKVFDPAHSIHISGNSCSPNPRNYSPNCASPTSSKSQRRNSSAPSSATPLSSSSTKKTSNWKPPSPSPKRRSKPKRPRSQN